MKSEQPKSLRPARQVPIFALSMDDTAAALHVSKPIVYSLIERGVLRTFLIGKRRLTTPEWIGEAVSALAAEQAPSPAEAAALRRSAA